MIPGGSYAALAVLTDPRLHLKPPGSNTWQPFSTRSIIQELDRLLRKFSSALEVISLDGPPGIHHRISSSRSWLPGNLTYEVSNFISITTLEAFLDGVLRHFPPHSWDLFITAINVWIEGDGEEVGPPDSTSVNEARMKHRVQTCLQEPGSRSPRKVEPCCAHTNLQYWPKPSKRKRKSSWTNAWLWGKCTQNHRCPECNTYRFLWQKQHTTTRVLMARLGYWWHVNNQNVRA